MEPCCRCDCWIDGGKEEARLRIKSVIDMLLYLRFYVFFCSKYYLSYTFFFERFLSIYLSYLS